MKFTTQPFQQKIEKPWGYEILFTPPSLERTGKILFVKAGKRLSLQYHDQKEETLCLLSGQATLWLEDNKGEVQHISMDQHKGYTVMSMQKHRIEAEKDSFILEVSSPEKGNTFRLEDDYKRPTETENLRSKPNRGWEN